MSSLYDLLRALVNAANGTPQYIINNQMNLAEKKKWIQIIDQAETLNLFSTSARQLGEDE